MTMQVHKFSLEEILNPNKSKSVAVKKSEEPVSEDIATLLSNVSKTIGIITYERKVHLKEKISKTLITVSRTTA